VTKRDDLVIIIEEPKRAPAEVIPHPAFVRRVAQEAIAKVTATPIDRFGATMIFKRAINDYRQRLELIGVAKHRIGAEVAALEQHLFPQPKRRRA
jgi:hypothetical protein